MIFKSTNQAGYRASLSRGTIIAATVLGMAGGISFHLQPSLALKLFVTIAIAIAVMRDARIGLLLLILSSPVLASIFPLFQYKYALLHVCHLIILLLTLSFIIRLALKRESVAYAGSIDTPLILLLFLAVFSGLNSYVNWGSDVPITHRHAIVQLTGVALIFFAVSTYIITRNLNCSVQWVKLFIFAIIAIATFLALFDIIHFIFGIYLLKKPFLYFVNLGVLFTIGFSLSLAFFCVSGNSLHRLAWLLIAVILFFTVLYGYSSGTRTLLAVVFSTTLILVLRSEKRLFWPILVIVVLGIVFSEPLAALFMRKTDSLNFRMILWKDTFNVLSQHWTFWFLGVGPGNYYAYSLVHTFNATDGGKWGLTTPHSQYFGILGELGSIGLFFFFWVMVNTLKTGYSKYKSTEDTFFKAFYLGVLGALSGLSIGSVFADEILPSVSNFGFNTVCSSIYVWIIIGLLFRNFPQGVELKDKPSRLSLSRTHG